MTTKNKDKFEVSEDKFDKFEAMDERMNDSYYAPPSQLDMPEEIEDMFLQNGFRLRWVRMRIGNGQIDTKNIRKRMHPMEGYTFVDPKEVPAEVLATLGDSEQFGDASVITSGDLVLMKVRREKSDARKKYYQGVTRSQSEAIAERLRQNSISGGNRTVVRTGKGAHFMGQ